MNNYINTYTDDTVNSNKPSVSYYKSLGKLVYSKDYRCTTNKSEAKPGDIVLSLPTSNNFNYFVSPDYYNVNASRISGSTYYPMGVVVVPSSHTEDSTVRIVSIKYMDYNNPVDGSDKPVEIYWGYKTDLSLTNLG